MTDPVDLTGQRVLLIAPRFFGYDEAIARGLTRKGATVDAMPDRPFASPWFHALARVRPALAQRLTLRHYRRLLAGLRPDSTTT